MHREVLNGKIGEGVDRRKKDDLREGLCLEKCLMGRLVKELIGGRRMI